VDVPLQPHCPQRQEQDESHSGGQEQRAEATELTAEEEEHQIAIPDGARGMCRSVALMPGVSGDVRCLGG